MPDTRQTASSATPARSANRMSLTPCFSRRYGRRRPIVHSPAESNKSHETSRRDGQSAAGARRKAMPEVRTIAVFCGAQAGDDPEFRAAADLLGRGLARSGIRLVYGGGRVGLMGALADAVLAAGGEVIGVIP